MPAGGKTPFPASIVVSLLAFDAGSISASNKALITRRPAAEAEAGIGGFLFPASPELAVDYMLIEGWAARSRDALVDVTLAINQRPLPIPVRCGIVNDAIGELLPDMPEASSAGFSTIAARGELIAAGVGNGELLVPAALTAECRFASGTRLTLNAAPLSWFQHPFRGAVRGVSGQLESLQWDPAGTVLLRGSVLSVGPALLGLTLRTRIIERDLRVGSDLSTYAREDLGRLYPILGQPPLGFDVRIDPSFLGADPGSVELYARFDDGSAIPVGEPERWTPVLARAIDQNTGRRRERWKGKGRLLAESAKRRLTSPQRIEEARPWRPIALPPRPRRLLAATHNLSAVEGAPKVFYQNIKALHERLAPDGLLVMSAVDGELRAGYEALGADVAIVPELALFGSTWESYRQAAAAAEKTVREFGADLVLLNVVDSMWAGDIAHRLGVPYAWMIHESIDPRFAFPRRAAELRMLFFHRLASADLLVFVAAPTMDLFRSVPDTKRVVIPNGIDLAAVERGIASLSRAEARAGLGLAEETIVITTIGTTTPRKGQDIFLREMALLRTSAGDRDLRFLIVGARELPFLEELKALSAELGLGASVTFVKETPETLQYFLASDVLVIASREESAPLVSLEAMAYGVPLVSTAAFGLAEQIQDNENGLLFSPDEPGQLAAKLKLLLDSAEERARLALGGKKSVASRYNLTVSSARFCDEVCAAYASRLPASGS